MKRWSQHLDEVNETYFEHMGNAMSFAGHMLTGAIACAIHAVMPFFFESTGSNRVNFLYDRMVVMRKRPDDPTDFSKFEVGNNSLNAITSQSTEHS